MHPGDLANVGSEATPGRACGRIYVWFNDSEQRSTLKSNQPGAERKADFIASTAHAQMQEPVEGEANWRFG